MESISYVKNDKERGSVKEYTNQEQALLDDLRALLVKHGAKLEIRQEYFQEEFTGNEFAVGDQVLITGDGINIEMDWYFGQFVFPDSEEQEAA